MEAHRVMREDALAREGVADAAAASRRALGNITLAQDDARDEWGWPRLDSLLREAGIPFTPDADGVPQLL